MKLHLLALLLLSACCQSATAATETVWKLKYISGPFTGGETTVYLAPNAIKLTALSSYEIYAKAPDWNATVYNLKTHCMCPVSKKEYMKGHLFFESEDSKNDLNPTSAFSTESVTLYGFPAQRKSWHTVSDEKNFYRIRRSPEPVVTQLSTTTQIPANEMQIGLIGAWAPIPHLKAIPLAFVDKHRDGKIQGRFYISKVEKTTLPASAFRTPTGYKQVKRTGQLYTEEYSGFLKEFLNQTDEYETNGPGKKQH